MPTDAAVTVTKGCNLYDEDQALTMVLAAISSSLNKGA